MYSLQPDYPSDKSYSVIGNLVCMCTQREENKELSPDWTDYKGWVKFNFELNSVLSDTSVGQHIL